MSKGGCSGNIQTDVQCRSCNSDIGPSTFDSSQSIMPADGAVAVRCGRQERVLQCSTLCTHLVCES
jgi:hypothetical protein